MWRKVSTNCSIPSRAATPIGTCAAARGGEGTRNSNGSENNNTPDDAKNIKCPVLVLHGADDPFVKPDEVAAFKTEMEKAKVKYQFVAYPGAVHSFTRSNSVFLPPKFQHRGMQQLGDVVGCGRCLRILAVRIGTLTIQSASRSAV